MSELEFARNLAVAALLGLAVGLEREWSGHAQGPAARFAGVRTFLILGLVGGIAGLLQSTAAWPFGLVAVAAGAALTVVAYAMAARRSAEDIDGTTEAAALLVLALGVLAGLGWIRISSGVAAVAVLMLREKEAIRGFVRRIGEAEIRAAIQFAVLALVVLPLLPQGPFGPYDAIRPRALWTVVLLISGVNYLGYLARKAVGDARGYVITGALGGLASSTAVTLAFARASRSEPAHAGAFARGTVAACMVLVPRLFALTVALNPGFSPRAGLVLVPFLVPGVAVLLATRRAPDSEASQPRAPSVRNPLQLGQALKMAAAFQVVLLGIEIARSAFGEGGVLAGAALAGLTDTDALTLSMSRLAGDRELAITAARALAVGVLTNTVLKAAVAGGLGAPAYRRVAVPGLGAMAGAGVASVFLAGV